VKSVRIKPPEPHIGAAQNKMQPSPQRTGPTAWRIRN
jgi:hypothetical protein